MVDPNDPKRMRNFNAPGNCYVRVPCAEGWSTVICCRIAPGERLGAVYERMRAEAWMWAPLGAPIYPGPFWSPPPENFELECALLYELHPFDRCDDFRPTYLRRCDTILNAARRWIEPIAFGSLVGDVTVVFPGARGASEANG